MQTRIIKIIKLLIKIDVQSLNTDTIVKLNAAALGEQLVIWYSHNPLSPPQHPNPNFGWVIMEGKKRRKKRDNPQTNFSIINLHMCICALGGWYA